MIADDWYNPTACDSNYQDAVELSISNLLFIDCDTSCLYDLEDTITVAYWMDVRSDGRCFQRIERRDSPSADCFGNMKLIELQAALYRVEQFCSNTGCFDFFISTKKPNFFLTLICLKSVRKHRRSIRKLLGAILCKTFPSPQSIV